MAVVAVVGSGWGQMMVGYGKGGWRGRARRERTHRHIGLQVMPESKHSQYFLRQRELRHLQPLRCTWPMAPCVWTLGAKARGLRCSTVRRS